VDSIGILVTLLNEANKKEELFVLKLGSSEHSKFVLLSWEDFRAFRIKKLKDVWFRHLYCMRDEQFVRDCELFI
jgi:hypothetical protein